MPAGDILYNQIKIKTPRYWGLLKLPTGYDGVKKYPLMWFLHGTGETGSGEGDLYKVANGGPPKMIKNNANFYGDDLIVFSIQYNYPNNPDFKDSVQYIIDHYQVDTDRIYATGLSYGGFVWYFARDYPELTTAVATCSANHTFHQETANVIAANDIHSWAVHNMTDPQVNYNPDKQLIDAINVIKPGLGGYNLHTSGGHDSWSPVYANNELIDGDTIVNWFLRYSKSTAEAWDDIADNSFVSRESLQRAVDDGVFQIKNVIPEATPTKFINSQDAYSYVFIDRTPLIGVDLLRWVRKDQLVPIGTSLCGNTGNVSAATLMGMSHDYPYYFLVDLGTTDGTVNITVKKTGDHGLNPSVWQVAAKYGDDDIEVSNSDFDNSLNELFTGISLEYNYDSSKGSVVAFYVKSYSGT